MTRTVKTVLLTSVAVLALFTLGAGGKQGSFSPYVDDAGTITLPADFRSAWVHLGTWVLTSKAQSTPGGHGPGLHEVYTQPESLKAFKKTGKWPEGTVLINEIRSLKWDDLPTGHVIYADESTDRFVMVRDTKGLFPNNPSWGNGWGWARFTAAASTKNASSNYKTDCLSCHDLAKDTAWVFVRGYPTLR